MTAQVVTITEKCEEYRPVKMIKWDWLSTDAGVVSSASSAKGTGAVIKAVIVPDGGGTAPTTLYDLTILDENGVDVLDGNGADCSATATEYLEYGDGLGGVVDSTLTLTIANAGDAKGGLVYLYYA